MAQNIELIGRQSVDSMAPQKSIVPFELYSLVIPAGKLGLVNTLRVEMQITCSATTRRPCAPDTPPANTGAYIQQAAIININHNDNNSDGANLRASWGFISDTDQVYALIRHAALDGEIVNGAPGDVFGRYLADQYFVWRLGPDVSIADNLDCVPVSQGDTQHVFPKIDSAFFNEHRAFPVEFGEGPRTPIGSSDEQSYMLVGGDHFSYFSIAQLSEAHFSNAGGTEWHGAGASTQTSVWSWAKKDNDLVCLLNNTNNLFLAAGNVVTLHNATSGALVTFTLEPWQTTFNSVTYDSVGFRGCPQITAGFIYVIADGASIHRIYKLSRSTLAVVSYIECSSVFATDGYPHAIAVVNDNFMYIWFAVGSSKGTMYYWNGSLHKVGVPYDSTLNNPLDWDGQFTYAAANLVFNENTGYWYIGGDGQNGADTDILKFGPAECP